MSLTAIAFLAAYFGCLFRAFSKDPKWGLYAYLLAFYAHPVGRWWGQSLPDLRWSFLAALVTLVAVFFSKKKGRWLSSKESKYYLVFLLYLLVQYLWVLNSTFHTIFVLLVVKYFILILLIQQCIKTKEDVIGFIICNAIGALYFGYLGYSYGGGRLEGVGGPGVESANGLGQHLAILLIMSSYLLLIKIGKIKYLLLFAVLVILNTIMLTESRGALLSLVLTGVVAIFFVPPSVKKIFFSLAILGAVAFSLLMGPQIVERFRSTQQNSFGEIQDKSAASRLVIIKAQYEIFKEKPFLGQGHRTTLVLSPLYIPEEYLTKVKSGEQAVQRRASHNFLMGMLTDHGIIGVILYALICLSLFKSLLKVRKVIKAEAKVDNELLLIQAGLCLGFVCYLIAGMFSNNKIFEIAVWLIALIPIINRLLEQSLTRNQNVN